jgi:hypothetical protein
MLGMDRDMRGVELVGSSLNWSTFSIVRSAEFTSY